MAYAIGAMETGVLGDKAMKDGSEPYGLICVIGVAMIILSLVVIELQGRIKRLEAIHGKVEYDNVVSHD